MEIHETAQSAPSPDAKRLRLHRSLEKVVGVDVADELIDFLPPSGWGDLVRKSDLEATERRLDAKIDALSQRVDARIDALSQRVDAQIDALSQRVESLQEEVRRLGNLRSTIIITGLSLFVGLGSLMVAMFQVTGR